MRLAILAGLAAAFAGAAWAQTHQQQHQTTPVDCKAGGIKASRAFVDALQAAQLAFTEKRWSDALVNATQARPHAMNGHQLSAVLQIEVSAYHELDAQPALRSALEAGAADACMPVAIRKNYQQMLDKLMANATTPQQQ